MPCLSLMHICNSSPVQCPAPCRTSCQALFPAPFPCPALLTSFILNKSLRMGMGLDIRLKLPIYPTDLIPIKQKKEVFFSRMGKFIILFFLVLCTHISNALHLIPTFCFPRKGGVLLKSKKNSVNFTTVIELEKWFCCWLCTESDSSTIKDITAQPSGVHFELSSSSLWLVFIFPFWFFDLCMAHHKQHYIDP